MSGVGLAVWFGFDGRVGGVLRRVTMEVAMGSSGVVSVLGFTPSDKSRLGLVQGKTQNNLEDLWEQNHGELWLL